MQIPQNTKTQIVVLGRKNTAAMKRKRLKYFNRRTTTHWPCPIYVNSFQPQTFGVKSLIGYSKLEKYTCLALTIRKYAEGLSFDLM